MWSSTLVARQSTTQSKGKDFSRVKCHKGDEGYLGKYVFLVFSLWLVIKEGIKEIVVWLSDHDKKGRT